MEYLELPDRRRLLAAAVGILMLLKCLDDGAQFGSELRTPRIQLNRHKSARKRFVVPKSALAAAWKRSQTPGPTR